MRALLTCSKKMTHLVYLRTTILDVEVFYNQILTNFYTKIDEAIRKQGEADIRACRDNDPVSNYFILNISNHFYILQTKFLASLAKEITNESNKVEIRQLGSTIFKNFIVNKANVSKKTMLKYLNEAKPID